MRKRSPSYSLVVAFDKSFKIWEGKFAHPSHYSEWRPVSTSPKSMRMEAQGHSYQAIIHGPAQMDLVYRLRGQDPVSGKIPNKLHWSFLSMTVSQVEPTLKLYDTYLPPLNPHQAQDGPLDSLDEVHKWMQLHRPDITDDRECGNLEFLCTLNTPFPEKMRYLLEL